MTTSAVFGMPAEGCLGEVGPMLGRLRSSSGRFGHLGSLFRRLRFPLVQETSSSAVRAEDVSVLPVVFVSTDAGQVLQPVIGFHTVTVMNHESCRKRAVGVLPNNSVFKLPVSMRPSACSNLHGDVSVVVQSTSADRVRGWHGYLFYLLRRGDK